MIQTLFGPVPQETGLFDRLKQSVQKTREGLVTRLEEVFAGDKEIDADLLEELEQVLLGPIWESEPPPRSWSWPGSAWIAS